MKLSWKKKDTYLWWSTTEEYCITYLCNTFKAHQYLKGHDRLTKESPVFRSVKQAKAWCNKQERKRL